MKSRFTRTKNGDSIVDDALNLEWKPAPENHTMTWPEALAHAWQANPSNLSDHRRDDQRSEGSSGSDNVKHPWRLPTVAELSSLVEISGGEGDIARADFVEQWLSNHAGNAWFWTATPEPDDSSYAFVVLLNYGLVDHFHHDNCFRVWLVRGVARSVIDYLTPAPDATK